MTVTLPFDDMGAILIIAYRHDTPLDANANVARRTMPRFHYASRLIRQRRLIIRYFLFSSLAGRYAHYRRLMNGLGCFSLFSMFRVFLDCRDADFRRSNILRLSAAQALMMLYYRHHSPIWPRRQR